MPSKRANGEGSISKTRGGKWKAAVSIKDEFGELRRLTKTDKHRAVVNEWLQQINGRKHNGELVASHNATVSEFMRFWIKNCVDNNTSPSTTDGYQKAIDNHIAPRIGDIKLLKLRPEDIQVMIASLQRERVGSRTIQYAYTVLTMALNKAVAFGKVPNNVCTRVEKPKHTPQRKESFTIEEASRIIKAANEKSTSLGLIITLAFHTGMRQGEIFALDWDDVDLKMKKVRVYKSVRLNKNKPEVGKTKNKKIRTLVLTDRVIDLFCQLKAEQLRNGDAGSEIVFINRRGNRHTSNNFGRRNWKPLLKKLNIPYRGLHHSRHTYASLSLEAGTPINVISNVLGHHEPGFTLRTYVHEGSDAQQAAANTIENIV